MKRIVSMRFCGLVLLIGVSIVLASCGAKSPEESKTGGASVPKKKDAASLEGLSKVAEDTFEGLLEKVGPDGIESILKEQGLEGLREALGQQSFDRFMKNDGLQVLSATIKTSTLKTLETDPLLGEVGGKAGLDKLLGEQNKAGNLVQERTESMMGEKGALGMDLMPKGATEELSDKVPSMQEDINKKIQGSGMKLPGTGK